MKGAETLNTTRGEFAQSSQRYGHSLIWLWPPPGALAPSDPTVLLDNNRLAAVTLRPGQSLILRRASVPEPALTQTAEGYEICVPFGDIFADVSRTPTRFSLAGNGSLTVDTEATGRLWVDLVPLAGPVSAAVPEWAAVGVGPVVLWHVPEDETAAWRRVVSLSAQLLKGPSLPGFGCHTAATLDVIDRVRRRAILRMPVPTSTTAERWEAGQPFILAGEAGSGKTTLAKAVYSVVGARRFAAVHPVAVEQEIDLVALTGCRDFAHDGRKVPDQEGHLDVATNPEGVVLIDEVHTLNDRFKKHLTDILTEWTFRPRGDSTNRKKIRGLFVFATNRPDVLRDRTLFPHDLFARMGGEPGIIEVPPLRCRRAEVPLLAAAVLDTLAPRLAFAPDAVRKLLLHNWPLNHWELVNAVREAHSQAASQRLPAIPAHLLNLSVPATTVPEPPREEPILLTVKAWRLPDNVGWRDLFQAFRHFSTFAALRDSWQKQLGANNAASVNRRIGRLIRCPQCDPATCSRCFSGALLQTDPETLLAELERLCGAQVDSSTGIAAALGELVVERVDVFRTDATRAALNALRASPDRSRLLEVLNALRRC